VYVCVVYMCVWCVCVAYVCVCVWCVCGVYVLCMCVCVVYVCVVYMCVWCVCVCVVERERNGQWHAAEWNAKDENGRNVKTGIYLYVLSVNAKKLVSGKLVYIK